MGASDYDSVRYPSRSYQQSHPLRLATTAMLLGMEPPPLERCRVLEIGCGDGSNLTPMGVGLPGSSFFGIDLAEKPIERGRALIAAAGLGNVRLESMNLLEFPAGLGEFDYIIAHGFYSWVPDIVRRKMWEVLAAHLSANGVAYVSYNAYPAGYLRSASRDMMNFHLAAAGTPDGERAAAGREFIGNLMEAAAGGSGVWKSVLQFESQRLNKQPLEVIRHDELEDTSTPFAFSDVVRSAYGAGLQYLAEASVRRLFTTPPTVPDSFGPCSLVEREQYLDYLEFRSFRETLFCRKEISLDRERIVERVSRAWLASPVIRVENGDDGAARFRIPSKQGTLETDNPGMIGVLDRLHELWPSAERFSDLPDAAGMEAAIANLAAKGLVELRVHQQVPRREEGRIPVASPLARAQFAEGARASNLMHAMVDVEEDGARAMVCMLDGRQSLDGTFGEEPEVVLRAMYRSGLLIY